MACRRPNITCSGYFAEQEKWRGYLRHVVLFLDFRGRKLEGIDIL